MSMTMKERIFRTIQQTALDRGLQPIPNDHAEAIADAALYALMEPTGGMTEAFSDRFSDWLDEIIEDPMHPYKMAIQAAREGK